jgi:hypothetical protein
VRCPPIRSLNEKSQRRGVGPPLAPEPILRFAVVTGWLDRIALIGPDSERNEGRGAYATDR